MKVLNKRVYRKIKKSKLQYLAITVVMMIGIMIYVAMNMGIYNFENSVNTYYEENNFADITVELVKIPKTSIRDVLKIEGVKAVEGRIKLDVPMKTEDDTRVDIRIISVPEELTINTLYEIDGKAEFKSDNDTFVVEQFIDGRKLKIGDILTPQINGKVHELNIVAEVGSPEYIFLMKDFQTMLPDFKKFGVIYVSEKFAEDAFDLRNSYNEIVVDVKNGYNSEKIKDEIDKKLDKYGVKSIVTRKDQMSNRVVTEEIKGGKQSSETMPLLFLVVAAIVLKVMISKLVNEDRMTIGVLKSMGYSNFRVLIHYAKFATFIGGVGGLLGITSGVILSKYLTLMYLTYYKVHYVTHIYYYKYLIGSVILSVGFSLWAGYFGAKKALKIAPAESMRKEAPKSGKRILFEGTILWKKLGFKQKMVLRNILRDKKRVLFIGFGVSVTLLVIVVPIHMWALIPQMFGSQFEEFQTMDYGIEFYKPISIEEMDDISKEINYTIMEPKLEYPFELESKWRDKIVNVIGLDKNTELFKFTDSVDRVVLPKENFVYLTEGLARYLDVKIGDRIHIKNYIPGKDDLEVKITGIIKQNLGTNVYIDIELMQEKLVEKNAINGIYLKTNDNIKEKLGDIKYISAINSTNDMISTFEEFMEITVASIGTMLFLGFILGFTIMYNTTLMTINSRKLEFSSLRILGMSKNEISGIVLKENLIMTIIGILIGIPLSALAAQGMTNAFSTEFYTFGGKILLATYAQGITLTLIFIGISQLAAFARIRKLNFIDALKERIS